MQKSQKNILNPECGFLHTILFVYLGFSLKHYIFFLQITRASGIASSKFFMVHMSVFSEAKLLYQLK